MRNRFWSNRRLRAARAGEQERPARALTQAAEALPPLVASAKCSACSVAGICLPDEVVLL